MFKKLVTDPYVEPEKKCRVEIYVAQKGKDPILVETRYFPVLKDALEYMDEVENLREVYERGVTYA